MILCSKLFGLNVERDALGVLLFYFGIVAIVLSYHYSIIMFWFIVLILLIAIYIYWTQLYQIQGINAIKETSLRKWYSQSIFGRTGSVKVYIWEHKYEDWGHAALDIPAANIYISWWPNWGMKSVKYSINTPAIKNRTFKHDEEAESDKKLTTIELKEIYYYPIIIWWDQFKQTQEYNPTKWNCSTVVFEALRKGGVPIRLIDKYTILTPEHLKNRLLTDPMVKKFRK